LEQAYARVDRADSATLIGRAEPQSLSALLLQSEQWLGNSDGPRDATGSSTRSAPGFYTGCGVNHAADR